MSKNITKLLEESEKEQQICLKQSNEKLKLLQINNTWQNFE